MHKRRQARMRRARKTRARIAKTGALRLTVHRTPRHMYAQIFAPDGSRTLVSASSLDSEVRKSIRYGGNVEGARAVGEFLARRAAKAGIQRVAFDRSGFKYHGRVKALAMAARAGGMEF